MIRQLCGGVLVDQCLCSSLEFPFSCLAHRVGSSLCDGVDLRQGGVDLWPPAGCLKSWTVILRVSQVSEGSRVWEDSEDSGEIRWVPLCFSPPIAASQVEERTICSIRKPPHTHCLAKKLLHLGFSKQMGPTTTPTIQKGGEPEGKT